MSKKRVATITTGVLVVAAGLAATLLQIVAPNKAEELKSYIKNTFGPHLPAGHTDPPTPSDPEGTPPTS